MSNKKKFALSFLVLAFLILIIFINYKTRRASVPEKSYEITRIEEEQRRPADPSVLNIVYFYPRGEVDDVNEIKVDFNKDMVGEEKVGVMTDTFPVEATPSLPLQFKWINPSELIITSTDRLKEGTVYSFKFLADITDIKGEKIERESSYSFTYKPLKLENYFLEQDKRVFRLAFNAPVPHTDIENYVRFKADGKELKYSLLTKTSAAHHRIVFEEKIVHPITFTIQPELNIAGSNYERTETIERVYDATGTNSIRRMWVAEQKGILSIYMDFNEKTGDLDAVDDFIEITPSLKTKAYTPRWYDRRLVLTASEFSYGETYSVRVKRGLFGISPDYVQTIKVPDALPDLTVLSDKHITASKGNAVLPIETINVDTVSVTAYDIYKNNIVYFAAVSGYEPEPQNLAKEMKQKQFIINAGKNEKQKNYIDLKELFDNAYGPKILYIYHNNYYHPQTRLVLLTDLGVFYKEIDNNLTVLAASIQTAQPVEGADIKVYSLQNQLLASGKTNKDGVASFENVSFENGTPYTVTAEKDGDINFLVINRGHLPTVSFDVRGDRYLNEKDIECFIYGEREIYKPSEKVNLKLIAKNKALQSVKSLPLNIKIKSPSGEEVYSHSHRTSENGTVNFSYESDLSSVTGFYTVTAELSGVNKHAGSASFQIEDFVPDKIETKITAEKTEYGIDEEIPFNVSSQYLFGKPASGNKVSAVSTLNSVNFSSKKYNNHTFHNPRQKFQAVFKEYGEDKLDEEGKFSYKVKLDKHTPPSMLELVFTATVFELGAKGVSATQMVKVHPYPRYIGIMPTEQNTSDYRVGETAKFKIIAVDKDEKIQPARVNIKVNAIGWNYVLKQDANGNYRYQWSKEETERISETIEVSGSETVYSFLVNDYGSYVIYAEDAATKMTSSVEFSTGWWWRSDARDKAADFEKIEIKLDKESYSENETARIDFTLPFDGIMYLFLEQNNVKYLTKVEVKNKKASMRLRLDETHIPGVYMSAVLISPLADAQFSNYRALGVKYIKVVPDNKNLNVFIYPPETLMPGRESEIEIKVSDKYGRKINGEVSLSIVDRGVLQLSRLNFGGPFEFYFRQRGNWIKNSDIFSFIRDEEKEKIIRTLVSAGDFLAEAPDRHKPAFQIKKEEVVSYWYPSLEIKNGEAKVKLKIPEFSGLLDFKAAAVSENAVGFGKISKEIKEPLVFNASYPEALSPGDEFEIALSVMSNLKEEETVTLSLDLTGPAESAFKEEKIKIKPGAEIQRNIKLKVKNDVGALNFKFRLKSKSADIVKTKDVAVRPPVPSIMEKELKEVKAGFNGQLNIKNDFFKGTQNHKIIFSKLPVGDILTGLQFLIRYPYGCVEQTTSSVFPQLYLADILQSYMKEFSNKEVIDRNIIDGINRLLQMQTADGGFSSWRGGRSSYSYGTVYAANFLFEAKNKNYPVPDRAVNDLKGYLKNLLKYETNDRLRAYACYVLSLIGDHNEALAADLLEKVDWPEKAYLITSLARAGKTGAVAGYLNIAVPSVSVSRTTGGYLTSDVKSTALILSALIDLNENHHQLTSMAHRLLSSANYRGHWGTTQDNAFAVIALGKYINKFKVEDADFKGTLYKDGKKILGFSHKKDETADLTDVSDLKLELEGKTAPLIYVISSGIPKNFDVKEVKNKMDIRRKFFTADGKEHKTREFVFGDLYIVELEISLNGRYSNMFVEDMIPGGFFIENPRIATRVYEIPHLKHDLRVDYEDIKNDRVIVFFNGQHRQNYRYLVRAGIKGKFAYPAAKGGCMYDADVEALIKTAPITVK